jgi:hypothetical protein
MRGPYDTGRSTTADPESVQTRDDLEAFLGAMLSDFKASGEAEWENTSLERFLDALQAVAAARFIDIEGDSHEPYDGQETASWSLFAEILAAATGYE